MKLYIAYNKDDKVSKRDGKIYKYITNDGMPLGFEKGSLAWEIFSDEGKNAVLAKGISKVLIEPCGMSLKNRNEYLRKPLRG